VLHDIIKYIISVTVVKYNTKDLMLMLKTYTRNTIETAFLIIFLAWISFIPGTLQHRYLTFARYALLFLLLISLLRHRFKAKEYFFAKEDIFIWAYFILISVGLINAVDRTMSVRLYMDIVIWGGLIYFLVKNSINEKNCKIILRFLVAFSSIVAAIGIMEMLFGKNVMYFFIDNPFYEKFIREKRIMSTLLNPAILGTYLLVCAPLACYFYSIEKKVLKKKTYLAMSTIIIVALILTFSRGAIFGGLIVISVYLWIKNKKKWIFIILAACILSSLLVLLLPYYSRLRYAFGMPYLIRYLIHSHRTLHYFVTFDMLKAHPFFGIGLFQYRFLFNQYSSVRLPYVVMIPESSYLMHLAETGIIGFSAFILLLVTLLKRGFAYLKGEVSSEKKKIFLFMFLGFIGLLFNMGTYDVFLWHTPFYLFWVFFGILSSFIGKGHNETIR